MCIRKHSLTRQVNLKSDTQDDAQTGEPAIYSLVGKYHCTCAQNHTDHQLIKHSMRLHLLPKGNLLDPRPVLVNVGVDYPFANSKIYIIV